MHPLLLHSWVLTRFWCGEHHTLAELLTQGEMLWCPTQDQELRQAERRPLLKTRHLKHYPEPPSPCFHVDTHSPVKQQCAISFIAIKSITTAWVRETAGNLQSTIQSLVILAGLILTHWPHHALCTALASDREGSQSAGRICLCVFNTQINAH